MAFRSLTSAALIVLVCVATAACGSRGASEYERYVALGDSYASAPLVPRTSTSDGCLQSDHNYPHLLAKRLGIKHLDDRSCAGADTSSMTRSQKPGIGPQFNALGKQTDLVTIGIGGNDEHIFGNLVVRCVQLRSTDPTGSPCADAVAKLGKAAMQTAYTTIAKRVRSTVAKITRLAPNATIVVVGYPQPFPVQGTCKQLPLATGDYAYGAGILTGLNAILKSAAEASKATWVDVAVASKGHDICSKDPWVNGSVTVLDAALAFHPFAKEQAAVAALIEEKLAK